jgi:pheromone shutdown-related protein TraB
VENNDQQDIIKEIEYKGSKITLLGTAHVSKESVKLVEEYIESGEYDCIAVELCAARHENLTNQSWWKNLDIFEVFRKKKASLLLVNLALSAYQKRLADQMGIQPGREMSRAIELAKEKNLRLEVVDRDITSTLQRTYRSVSFWQKMKLFSSLVASIFIGEEVTEQQIEDLKKGDMLHSMLEEFGDALPNVKLTLIDERDQYMVGNLARIADSPDAPKKMLAIVGAGHLPGMVPAFSSPASPEVLEELSHKPPPGKTGLYIGWGICLVILSMFFYGYQKSPELGLSLVITWVVINGGFSALGAALAFAHPISVVTAFFAAPLTSLNPTIGAGMVVGLVESYIRKPKVGDFEKLREDIAHVKLWWKNGVLKVLLTFFFANLGSMVGTYVAGASIIHQIFGDSP